MLTFKIAQEIIDQEIRKSIEYPEQPRRLYEPMAYLLELKGKRIRPILALAAYNLYEDELSDAIPVALAWEILHNFTLMHDDLMDKADMRRGNLTVHKKWDENLAILSGDAMLILAYTQLAKSPRFRKELLDLFSKTAAEICQGQEYDMQFENRMDVAENEYLEMIRLKTAVLLGASLKSGALIGNGTERDCDLLYDFGINIGLAFQIQDDLLDVFGDPSIFGKKLFGDILCNKKTYLLISALSAANEKEKEELLFWLHSKDHDEEKIKAIVNLYNQLHVEEKARKKIEHYYQQALRLHQEIDAAKNANAILLDFAANLKNRQS